MYCIILCGGSGTRLWPLSRKNFAKQFLKLYSDKSLLQETFLRMKGIVGEGKVYFVTNEDNFFNVLNQIREVDPDFSKENIITEPAAMNTAPAIALGMRYLGEKVGISKDASVIINPADHYIGNPEKYSEVVKGALQNVADNIGTIGITPTGPETGFGYIKKGKKENLYFRAESFKEKPDRETAQKYLESGEYVWNGGMYIFNSQSFEKELEKHAPKLWEKYSEGFDKLVEEYKTLESEPIDTAVSEKSDSIVIFEGDFGWSDIGSFDVLAEILKKKKDPNPKHVSVNSKNTFSLSTSDRLIVISGMDDVIVVENNDSILIQKMGESNDGVKKVVEYLKENNYPELSDEIIVNRPWGRYVVLYEKQGCFKVKRFHINPRARLSLQSHKKRSENWVVVRGEAKITRGEEILHLTAGESTFVPAGTIHRLENPTDEEIEFVEVQSGSYLEEDDIIRYEDGYGRPREGSTPV